MTSALHEREIGQLFWERTNSSRFPWHRARLSGRLDSLSVPFTTKTSMSAARASDFHPTGHHGAEECRDFDWLSLTANFELMLIKVCDEVSMRLCFWLTAAIGPWQERLPSLLVDPAYVETCVVQVHAGLKLCVCGDRRMSPLSCGCHHRGQFANSCRSHGANALCSFLVLRPQSCRTVSRCR